MSNPYEETIRIVSSADLPSATKAITLDLLAAANRDCGLLRLTWDRFLEITGCQDRGSARRHLTRLAQCRAIHYDTNDYVRIDFLAWAKMPNVEIDQQNCASAQSDLLTVGQIETTNGYLDQQDCAPGCVSLRAGSAPTYTRARAPVSVCLSVDLPDHNNNFIGDKENQTDRQTDSNSDPRARVSPPVDETERALSFALLSHVGIKPAAIADRLAKAHPFEHVRQAVAYWYMERESVGGKFKDTPQIVIHWLNKWETFMIPPLSAEFKATALYADHCKTPTERRMEREAERMAEDAIRAEIEREEALQAIQAAIVDSPAPDASPGDVSPEIRQLLPILIDELRLEMAPETFDRWCKGWQIQSYADGRFVIAVGSVQAQDWLRAQLAVVVGRKLGSMVKRRCAVDFEAVGGAL